jgi:Putative DNA-binding domain
MEQTKTIILSDEDILLRLATFEDTFVERKTASDSKDWRKTVVAFANSAPVGYPAILFIGVRNNGTIEEETNLDSLQSTLGEKLSAVYPSVYYLPRVLRHNGKQFLAVIVPGSENRPHFAGPAFIREGSKSIQSSSKQFEILVAERNSKVREIRSWKGKLVTFQRSATKELTSVHVLGTIDGKMAGVVIECNQFYVTVESTTRKGNLISFPLEQIEINFDHFSDRLELRFRD